MGNSITATNPPWPMPPSVLIKYPIKNGAWWRYAFQNKVYDPKLEAAFQSIPSLVKYFHNISMLNGEVFMAKLEDTRPKRSKDKTEVHPTLSIGHTYDPWWRSITEHTSDHYKKISPHETGFDCDVKFQITVQSNSEEVLVFWGFNSSIDKTPIYLILYTFVKFAYVDKFNIESHLNAIHPYRSNASSNYDLTNKYIGPYTGIDNTPYATGITQSYMEKYMSSGSFSTSKWVNNLNKADDVDLWSPKH